MSRTTPTNAAAQFAALGVPESAWTDAMRLAVKQKWSSLPVDQPVAELRRLLAEVEKPAVPSIDELRPLYAGDSDPGAAATVEHRRLARNASVQAWRTRNQLQAALDAREAKFAGMRAKRKQPAGAVA